MTAVPVWLPLSSYTGRWVATSGTDSVMGCAVAHDAELDRLSRRIRRSAP